MINGGEKAESSKNTGCDKNDTGRSFYFHVGYMRNRRLPRYEFFFYADFEPFEQFICIGEGNEFHKLKMSVIRFLRFTLIL